MCLSSLGACICCSRTAGHRSTALGGSKNILMPQKPCQQAMDEQRSSAERPSVTPAESSSSSRAVDVPIIVPAFVFSLGFGEGALMDPSKQRSAFEDSPRSDEPAVSTFSPDLSGEAVQRGCQGAIEESQNQQQEASACSGDFGDQSGMSHLGGQDAHSSTLSSVQQSPAPSSPSSSDEDLVYRREQRDSVSGFGHSDGDIMNQLVPQGMFDKALDLNHQQHSLRNLGSGDHEFTKLEPQDAFCETLRCDQQPAFLHSLGLRDKSVADQKDSFSDTLRPAKTYESTLNQPGFHDESKNQLKWEAQPSAEQSSAADTFRQSTQLSIAGWNPPDANQKAFHASEDVEPLAVDLMPALPSSPPSGQMNGEGHLKGQDALEKLLKSQQPEHLVTSNTSEMMPQQPPDQNTELYDSPINQATMELALAAALSGADEPMMSQEASLRTPSPDDTAMMYPGSELHGGQACHQQCVREGCPNPSVVSREWDGEYCSTECVVLHCNRVFSNWVARRLGTEGAVQHTSLTAERPYLQH
nr:uncharacterized protein LOC126521948 [Dermacentor andersoni]